MDYERRRSILILCQNIGRAIPHYTDKVSHDAPKQNPPAMVGINSSTCRKLVHDFTIKETNPLAQHHLLFLGRQVGPPRNPPPLFR